MDCTAAAATIAAERHGSDAHRINAHLYKLHQVIDAFCWLLRQAAFLLFGNLASQMADVFMTPSAWVAASAFQAERQSLALAPHQLTQLPAPR